jgi:hypothetical protein
MPRTRKPPEAALSAAPTSVAEPRPTPLRPVDAPSPPGVPVLVWLDSHTYAAFRQSASEARMPLEWLALHLRECAMPNGKGPP